MKLTHVFIRRTQPVALVEKALSVAMIDEVGVGV